MKRPFPRSYEIVVTWEEEGKCPHIVMTHDGQPIVSADCPLQELLEQAEGLIEQIRTMKGETTLASNAAEKTEIGEKVVCLLNNEPTNPEAEE